MQIKLDRQRLEKYTARTLIWRPVSIGIAIPIQMMFYLFIYPHLGPDIGFIALVNTLFINLWLIPTGIGWEFFWHWIKHRLFKEYRPGQEPGHSHLYKFRDGMWCDCGANIEDSPIMNRE